MGTGTERATMPYDEHTEDGRFKRKFSDDDVADALESHGSLTTSEVAEAVGCSSRLALDILRGLEDDGHVSEREVGNTFLWTVNDD